MEKKKIYIYRHLKYPQPRSWEVFSYSLTNPITQLCPASRFFFCFLCHPLHLSKPPLPGKVLPCRMFKLLTKKGRLKTLAFAEWNLNFPLPQDFIHTTYTFLNVLSHALAHNRNKNQCIHLQTDVLPKNQLCPYKKKNGKIQQYRKFLSNL